MIVELGLATDEDQKAIHADLKQKGYIIDASFVLKSNLPEGIAEKVFAGLVQMKEMDLVVVETGSTNQYKIKERMKDQGLYGAMSQNFQRTGVMSKEDFHALYDDGRGHDYVARICRLSDGTEIDCEFKAILDYFSFAHEFDSDSGRWVRKFDDNSLENAVLVATEEAIREILKEDPVYSSAPSIRATLQDKVKEIVKVANEDGEAKAYIKKRVLEEVTLANLKLFYRKFSRNKDVKSILGENPTNRDLWRFHDNYSERLDLVHGHLKVLP